MAKKQESVWFSGLAINLASNLIAAIVAAAVTYFSHEGSTWIKPLLFGGTAWLVTFVSILAVRFMRRIPRKVEQVTPENVGQKIRDWLDDFNLTVKRITDPDSYFLFIVTTDGGKKISIFRSKGKFTDYIEFRSHLDQTEEEKRILAGWSQDEKTATTIAIQLELARAVMGYKFEDGFEKLTIFKRLPITSSLTAEEVFKMLWDVEAMIGAIYAVAAMGIHKHNMKSESKSDTKTIQGGNGSAKELPHSH